MHISEISVRRPVTTTMVFLAIILLGAVSFKHLSLDLLPDISNPVLTITTRCSNMPPEEVERLITRPLEEVISTVKGKKHVESISVDGLSIIRIRFQWGTQLEYAILETGQKIEQVRPYLPEEAERPVIMRSDPASLPVMTLAMSGKDLMRLKDFSEHVIKRRLEQIKGVAMVRVVGGLDKEIHVRVNLKKLQESGLTIQDVAKILQEENFTLPGGQIKRGYFRLTLRTEGEFKDLDDIRNIVITRLKNKSAVYLKDVADVTVGFRERTSVTQHNGMESVGLLLIKEAGSNTVQVCAEVKKVLKELEKQYEGISFHIISDQSRFIRQSISNVILAIVLGGILSFLVLFFFLNDLKSPVFVAISIPVSVIFAFILFYFFNINLNLMSLGGLALGLGMLVDSSIVVIENIYRLKEEGADRTAAAISGAKEVTLPVVASTLTTLAVFLPIVFIKGIASLLFRQQALAVTFSLLASTLVALTLLPMLVARFNFVRPSKSQENIDKKGNSIFSELRTAYKSKFSFKKWIKMVLKVIFLLVESILLIPFRILHWLYRDLKELFLVGIVGILEFLKKISRKPISTFQHLLRKIMGYYESGLVWAMQHRKSILGITFLLFLISLLLSSRMKKEWLPQIDAHEFMVQIEYPAGISLEANQEYTANLEKLLSRLEGVEDIFSFIGHQPESFTGENIQEINRAAILVKVNPNYDTFGIIEQLEKELPELYQTTYKIIPSQSVIGQILRVSEADLMIKVQGESFEKLLQIARELAEELQKLDGLQNVQVMAQNNKPEIVIRPNRENCKQFGISFETLSEILKNQFMGEVATQLKEFEKKTDIRVLPDESYRDDLSDIIERTILINGEQMPLRNFVSVEKVKTLKEIRRVDQQRTLFVTADITEDAPAGILTSVRDVMNKIDKPSSYIIDFAGEQEEMSSSFHQLIYAFILSVILIYMILAAQFESFRYPLVIMFTVPMAVIGVIFTLWILGLSWNVMSLIGTVVLVGIVVNDAIVKVDFINQERRRKNLMDAIFSAGEKRFRPIVMTTVTTVLGMLPMALGVGEGSELQKPLAMAVIGGISLSTFLTLFVIPILYYQLSPEKDRKNG